MLPDLEILFFDKLDSARRILIAGTGGAFDLAAGLPLYFALRRQRRSVFLGSVTPSDLSAVTGRHRLGPALVEVTAGTDAGTDAAGELFPERELAAWFRNQGDEVPVYCFARTGVWPLVKSCRALVELLDLDTVILVDRGGGSLLRGDEAELGTPEDDIAVIAAVNQVDLRHKMLVVVGFGVERRRGLCHSHLLRAVAELTATGGLLGSFSLLSEMPAVRRYRGAVEAIRAALPEDAAGAEMAIAAALDGRFGDYHAGRPDTPDHLWLSPLMPICWCFQVQNVAERVMYLDRILETETREELRARIDQFRAVQAARRPWEGIPI